jgi:hypothetical protein
MSIMRYELDISIDENAVSSIVQAMQAVTIVKVVTSIVMTADGSKTTTTQGYLPVAWLEFQPFETNTVTWTETYQIYASNTVLVAGTPLQQLSNAQVQLGMMYTFETNTFNESSCDQSATYNLKNAQGTKFNFGLSQQAIVNGSQSAFAPLNAIPVLNNQQATFSPIDTVYIFLSTYCGDGVVISGAPGQALAVTLTPQTPVAKIAFNETTNTFYLET